MQLGSSIFLWKISKKQSVLIGRYDPNLVPVILDRLNEMGFVVGQVIRCLRRSSLK